MNQIGHQRHFRPPPCGHDGHVVALNVTKFASRREVKDLVNFRSLGHSGDRSRHRDAWIARPGELYQEPGAVSAGVQFLTADAERARRNHKWRANRRCRRGPKSCRKYSRGDAIPQGRWRCRKGSQTGILPDFRKPGDDKIGAAFGYSGLQAGSLDDTSIFRPALDVFASSTQPWDHMNPDIEKTYARSAYLMDAVHPMFERRATAA